MYFFIQMKVLILLCILAVANAFVIEDSASGSVFKTVRGDWPDNKPIAGWRWLGGEATHVSIYSVLPGEGVFKKGDGNLIYVRDSDDEHYYGHSTAFVPQPGTQYLVEYFTPGEEDASIKIESIPFEGEHEYYPYIQYSGLKSGRTFGSEGKTFVTPHCMISGEVTAVRMMSSHSTHTKIMVGGKGLADSKTSEMMEWIDVEPTQAKLFFGSCTYHQDVCIGMTVSRGCANESCNFFVQTRIPVGEEPEHEWVCSGRPR